MTVAKPTVVELLHLIACTIGRHAYGLAPSPFLALRALPTNLSRTDVSTSSYEYIQLLPQEHWIAGERWPC